MSGGDMACARPTTGAHYLEKTADRAIPSSPSTSHPRSPMTTTTPAGRLPWEPLGRLLRARYDSADMLPGLGGRRPGHGLWCDAAAALVLDTNIRQIQRWKTEGLTARFADRAAARLNLHALEIWGNAWLCAEIGESVRRQARRRRQPFTPTGHVDRAVAQALTDARTRVRFAVRHVIAAAKADASDADGVTVAPQYIRPHQTMSPSGNMEAAA
jgi:hypothetical protein